MRNAFNTIEACRLLVSVVELEPVNSIYLCGVDGVAVVHPAALLPNGYTEDIEILAVEFLPYFLDIRDFSLARRAPRRPEIHEHDLALAYELGEAVLFIYRLVVLVDGSNVLYSEISELHSLGSRLPGSEGALESVKRLVLCYLSLEESEDLFEFCILEIVTDVREGNEGNLA